MKICPQCQRTYVDDMEFCPQDGSHLTAQATAAEGQLAAGLARRFRIVRRLGAGGMGTVYLAEQIGVGNRPVALKVLNRKLLDDPEFLLRFQNEAGSTGRIHQANVVTIYESGQADDGTPYIAMEYLDGETLREALKSRGALPIEECAEILQQTAQGLNAAHKLGIIHRDLKPDNIFLTQGDRGELLVKIVDFGIAKLRESATHTLTGMVLGTPAYMSSEQAAGIRSDQLDLRSDIYSLGIVVYEMLTGSVPFHSDTPLGFLRKHMLEPPPPISTLATGLPVPPLVEAAVMKALAKERGQRYNSAPEFAGEFTRAVSASAQSDTLPTTRVVDFPESAQLSQEWPVQERGHAVHREAQLDGAEFLAPEKTGPESSFQEMAEARLPKREKTGVEHIAPEPHTPPIPGPPQAPVPMPIRPAPKVTPRPANGPTSLPEPWKADLSFYPQPASVPPRQSLTRFFKVGFWILGVSQIILILRSLLSAFNYASHYGVVQWLYVLVELLVGTAFVVIYCGFLGRKPYSLLIWLSLVFSALGTIANNVYWPAVMGHLTYAELNSIGMFRAFFLSSGLPLSSLLGPIVLAHFGRVSYYAGVVNIDCVLKLGFLIWAIAKYHTESIPSVPPSLPRTPR